MTESTIEFCCPVCRAALAIKKQSIGGQVNCPKCQKLILLPSDSPLPRHEPDKPPYQNGQVYSVQEVTQAICTSVDPYRRDLETKANLLNDAVEMVKLRNERIKEIETLMLNTQGELWALEVDAADNENSVDPSAVETLAEEKTALLAKKDLLKVRLANMVEHSEKLDQSLKAYRTVVHPEGEVTERLEGFHQFMVSQSKQLQQGSETTAEAQEWIQKLLEAVGSLQQAVAQKQKALDDLNQVVGTSNEDMQQALDERDQWRKQSEVLEKKAEELQTSLDQKDEQFEASASSSDQAMKQALDERNQYQGQVKELATQVATLTAQIEGLTANTSELTTTLHKAEAKLQEATSASEQSIQQALDERDQWRNQAGVLEKTSAEITTSLEKCKTRLEEAEQLQADWAQDRETAKNLRQEMEENLQLLRDRIETERATSRKALEEREEKWNASAEKKRLVLERKLEQANEELSGSESKRMEALKTQQQLADQQLKTEQELSALKEQLKVAQDRIDELEE